MISFSVVDKISCMTEEANAERGKGETKESSVVEVTEDDRGEEGRSVNEDVKVMCTGGEGLECSCCFGTSVVSIVSIGDDIVDFGSTNVC